MFPTSFLGTVIKPMVAKQLQKILDEEELSRSLSIRVHIMLCHSNHLGYPSV